MPKGQRKLEVIISDQLYRRLESLRRARGLTWRATIQEALRRWLQHEAHQRQIREYEAGYRRQPEGSREINAAQAAAALLLATEDW